MDGQPGWGFTAAVAAAAEAAEVEGDAKKRSGETNAPALRGTTTRAARGPVTTASVVAAAAAAPPHGLEVFILVARDRLWLRWVRFGSIEWGWVGGGVWGEGRQESMCRKDNDSAT